MSLHIIKQSICTLLLGTTLLVNTMVLLFLVAGCLQSRPATPVTPLTISKEALREELLKREAIDQEVRAQLAENWNDLTVSAELMRVDAENTAWLKQVVATFGWPSASLVGVRAADAAWLLVQHADHDVAFQAEVLALLAPLVEQGEASKQNYAYLYDRVAVNEGRPQRYATQGQCTGPHTWDPGELEDAAQVDALRRSTGLPPLGEYKKQFYSICP